MALGATPTRTPAQFIRTPDDTANAGKRIRNLLVQAFVDQGDGGGPQLVDLLMQVVGIVQCDDAGNPLSKDDLINDYEWKRQVLDELRAIRLGMQVLAVEESVTGSNRAGHGLDGKFELLAEAQALREEQEN